MRRRTTVAAAAGLVLLASGSLAAQDSLPKPPPPQPRDSTVRVDRNRNCNGQTVTDLTIDARRPPFQGSSGRWRRIARFFGLHHRTTREKIIRRFVLLDVGEACSELRRAESERILRAQPYLAAATVRAVPDGRGGVRLEVVTIDEVPAVLGGNVSHGQVSMLRLGNTNVMGDAVAAQVEWRQGFFYRDALAASITDYQFAGEPFVASVDGRRGRVGGSLNIALNHPFYTDLQRVAWRATYGGARDFVRFVRPDSVPGSFGDPSLSVVREYWDVGGLLRVGQPGRLSLFGLSVSREREANAGAPVVVSDSGLLPDTAAALVGRYPSFRATRVNALWGIRNVRYVTVQGFDALTAVQDVRTGFQLGSLLGRSLPALGASDDDIFVGGDLYVGWGTKRSLLAMQVQGEGRQDGDTQRWDGILGSGRLASYTKIGRRHTLIASHEMAGGWRQRVPFQLTLGAYDGGVRGYHGSRVAGAQRAVTSVEDHWFIGRFRSFADMGVAPFVDAGRMWAGDAPFGTTTRTPKFGAGIGLLASVPPRSKRLYRLDVAFPLSPDGHAKWEVRLSSSDNTHDFLRQPNDVQRSRGRTVPVSVFSWP
ncbi:MAG TPA: hypothetical protein VFJ74_04915 [Gemmatimonadaceae bacterium]|nr:hypothetical protein [Gemmatimonadaceae bacterium]